jgi:hypothetical protein
VVVGEGELVWPQLLADFEKGALKRIYRACALPDLERMPAPRWDLIQGRVYGKGVTIATRGCPRGLDGTPLCDLRWNSPDRRDPLSGFRTITPLIRQAFEFDFVESISSVT